METHNEPEATLAVQSSDTEFQSVETTIEPVLRPGGVLYPPDFLSDQPNV